MEDRTYKSKYKRIALVGDTGGIRQLIKHVPARMVRCIIAASIRPQYLQELKKITDMSNVPLLVQPKYEDMDYEGFLNVFEELKIDLLLCNSYSMIIRNDLLKLVKYRAVNVHGSLLPKNRGPNPIQWAIIRNEETIGVTMHYMDNDLDTGDIIGQKVIPIPKAATWVDIRKEMDNKIEELLAEEIPLVLAGKNTRFPQDHSIATCNMRITPDFPLINFEKMSDLDVYNLIRAQVYPLKGAYILQNGKKIRFEKMIPVSEVAKLRKKYTKK
ncbi:MAG: formyltransferase family protein [Patescibacteria group bacterium]